MEGVRRSSRYLPLGKKIITPNMTFPNYHIPYKNHISVRSLPFFEFNGYSNL